MKKVIIFGGCGFLGSWIVRGFLKKGYSVSIFDLKIQKELLSNVIGEEINKIKFINGDITNFDQVQEATNNMDHVINLAGLMTPDCSSNPILGAKVNLLGSINVFEALKKNTLASESEVFFFSDAPRPGDEEKVDKVKKIIEENFNLSPRGIREMLNLNKPIYEITSAYGHFGRKPTNNGQFTWEKINKTDLFKL